MRTASNRYAFGFCDRTGFRYPLNELVDEYKNGVKTGLRVGRDVADDDHPQNFLGRVRIFDPQSLANARPDRSLAESRQLFGFNPVWNPAQFMTASVGKVTISFNENLVSPAGVSATGITGSVLAIAPKAVATSPSVAIGGVGSVTVSGATGLNASVTAPSATGASGAVGVAGVITSTIQVTGPIAYAYGGAVTASTNISQVFTVTVVNSGYGNKYYIDGVEAPTGNINEGETYRFDQSDASNSGHPLRFSTTSNGTHAGGVEYTTGVTTSGTPGNAGAYTQIVVASGAPTLYYYCTNHSGMGGQVNTP